MNDIQKEIVKWHKETFPNATEQAIFDKLIEEATELSEIDEEYAEVTMDEIAYVIIVACSLLGRWGKDIDDVVNHKLFINKHRKWGKETANGDRPRDK